MSALDPGDLVEAIGSSHRLESMLVARRLAAVAALLCHRLAAAQNVNAERGYAAIDGFDQATAEIAAAMNLSPTAASYMVSYAQALDVRLPKIAALLAEGRTDWRTVRLIISRTDLVTDGDLIAKLDESLSARIVKWHGWSKQRIVNAVDAAVRVMDPDAARERRVAAEQDRHISVTAQDNGMAEVHGTVAAAAAAAFDRRLSQLAKQVCPADPRTLDQRRADALAALTEGRRLACCCGKSGCPNKTANTEGRDMGGAQVVVNVVASEQTVYGDSAQPGYLEGYGVIDAEQVRELAAAASVRLADFRVTPTEAVRYQPSAALERAIRCRDLTCRFPGCSRPAMVCDIDHTIPFNHSDPKAGGLTVPSNLKCLCRQHHRLKTFGGWRDAQLADGTVVWTSPTGRIYRTAPAGAELFPQWRTPACATPTPSRRSRAKQRAGRIARARRHNRLQRPINKERRHLAEARKDEIAARKFRNHMRDMLFLFKGKPSTSPFCPWVNDPREPEELPPDWQPPPLQPLPDDPPF
ncbi:HNH endonuclease signature motif containing protein [Mycobacterium xenopi]|nr:HNH endonuclease signature motif containing protein [Mycobacterium xenopi]MDA3638050.1 HNH endonuclease signature motif containing protein [Mycobacterium xenopi]MDA3660562.1 HNH endonuclease signature motif containing protein [Mycobacterium xenopi]ORX09616.1 HNH nuclease [Mycobacterium xenopi]